MSKKRNKYMNSNQNNKPKLTFENHRLIWNSEAFIRELFQIDKNVELKSRSDVLKFKEQIRNIPNKRRFTIVGYGSLMNASDVPRTMPNAENHRLGILKGYERIFNLGYYKTSYLNVREAKNPSDSMQVALIDIPFTDLPNFLLRERNYDIAEVEVKDQETGEMVNALMVIARDNTNDSLLPQLNYAHLCLTGAFWLNGLEGVNDFLNTTYCYSEKHHQHVKIRTWLKDLDLINYMFMHEYQNR